MAKFQPKNTLRLLALLAIAPITAAVISLWAVGDLAQFGNSLPTGLVVMPVVAWGILAAEERSVQWLTLAAVVAWALLLRFPGPYAYGRKYIYALGWLVLVLTLSTALTLIRRSMVLSPKPLHRVPLAFGLQFSFLILLWISGFWRPWPF